MTQRVNELMKRMDLDEIFQNKAKIKFTPEETKYLCEEYEKLPKGYWNDDGTKYTFLRMTTC